MAIVRFLGRGTVVACAVSSVLAGCSSVEPEQKMAGTQVGSPALGQANGTVQTVSPNGQLAIEYRSGQFAPDRTTATSQPAASAQAAAVQVAAAPAATQPTVTVTKTVRLPIPLPTAAAVTPVQTAAMASPAMAPIVAFAPTTPSATTFPPAPAPIQARTSAELASMPTPPWTTPATSTILAAGRQEASASAKVGRLVSPGVAPAVAEGRIQPAAAQAIALDEAEPTPDMVALQSVVPIPRPDIPALAPRPAQPAASGTTLAYASNPRPLSTLSAVEFPPAPGEAMPVTAANAPSNISNLVHRYAGMYGVPESLVHRVIHRESKYDPKAYHKDGYWGLMQIKYSTAKSMGYEGPANGLLDAETNLKYAIKYLRGAWLVADNKNDHAIKLYARGYYFDAKRKDMLHVLEK